MSKQQRQVIGLIRQGDVLLVPVEELPLGATRIRASKGTLVLAQGETSGHAHVIANRRARLFRKVARPRFAPPLERRYLSVIGSEPVALTHQEHDSLPVPPGVYELRRQREYAPERDRWVRD